MEFSAKKSDLLRELNLTQGVVEKKTTIPILSNLLLECEGSVLRVSATDLELGFRCVCPAKIKKEGAGTVPAKRLLEIIRSLPDADVHLKVLENHWVQMNCERTSFKLVGMAKDNFPALPALPKALAVLPAGVLTGLVQKTIFAISNEESRYTLNGALLVLKPDRVSMVATDGHRLAMIECDSKVEGISNELRALVPKKAMVDKGKFEVFSSSGEYGEAHETLDATYDGEALQIGFNYQYLLDFLNVLGESGRVRFELKDEQSAGQLRPVGDEAFRYRYVVMPMRI